jgi:amino acid transporter
MTQAHQSAVPLLDERVAKFGYKQEMERTTGRFASFAVAFGFVSIATGIFTAYGSVLTNSGPAGIWTWPIVVLGQLLVAYIFGSLCARIPVTGYSYQWTSRLANPLLGWIMGWVSFMFLAVVVVAVDYTIPGSVRLLGYEATAVNLWLVTAGILAVQAALVCVSTRLTQKVNNVAVMIQLIGMIGLVVLLFGVGLFRGDLDWSRLFDTAAIPREGYLSFGSSTKVGPWMLGFLLGAFTIVGFESAANLSEETHDPANTVPRSMSQAVLSLGAIGMLFLIAVTALIPDPVELAKSGTPVADVIKSVLGPFVGTALLVMVVISIFSCGLVITMSGARLVWAMSRDKRFPGWQLLQRISPKFGTPLNATLFVTIIAELILAGFAQSQNALFTLFSAATLLPAVIYFGTVLMYLVKRKSLPPTMGFTLGAWEMPVIIGALVWLAFELSIFRDAQFANSWKYVGAMLAVGAVYLAVFLARHGMKGLTMPDMHNIDAQLDVSPTDAARNLR